MSIYVYMYVCMGVFVCACNDYVCVSVSVVHVAMHTFRRKSWHILGSILGYRRICMYVGISVYMLGYICICIYEFV